MRSVLEPPIHGAWVPVSLKVGEEAPTFRFRLEQVAALTVVLESPAPSIGTASTPDDQCLG